MTAGADIRFVAHLDMLGMSALSIRDPDRGWAVLLELALAVEERFGLQLHLANTGEPIHDRSTEFIFSDTVVAFTEGDTPADLQAIVVKVTEFFASATARSIPMRGGVAHGRFMVDHKQNLFAGPALVHAFRLGEDAQWLGIRVDDEVAARAKAIPMFVGLANEPFIIPWRFQDECASDESSHVINWIASHRESFTVSRAILVEEFYKPFEDLFGAFEDLPDRTKQKYINTVAFMNAQLGYAK